MSPLGILFTDFSFPMEPVEGLKQQLPAKHACVQARSSPPRKAFQNPFPTKTFRTRPSHTRALHSVTIDTFVQQAWDPSVKAFQRLKCSFPGPSPEHLEIPFLGPTPGYLEVLLVGHPTRPYMASYTTFLYGTLYGHLHNIS